MIDPLDQQIRTRVSRVLQKCSRHSLELWLADSLDSISRRTVALEAFGGDQSNPQAARHILHARKVVSECHVSTWSTSRLLHQNPMPDADGWTRFVFFEEKARV